MQVAKVLPANKEDIIIFSFINLKESNHYVITIVESQPLSLIQESVPNIKLPLYSTI